MIMIMIAEQSYIMKENYKVQSLNTNSVWPYFPSSLHFNFKCSSELWVDSSNLAELHFQVVRIAAKLEERLFKSFNKAPFNVVVWSWWKLEIK